MLCTEYLCCAPILPMFDDRLTFSSFATFRYLHIYTHTDTYMKATATTRGLRPFAWRPIFFCCCAVACYHIRQWTVALRGGSQMAWVKMHLSVQAYTRVRGLQCDNNREKKVMSSFVIEWENRSPYDISYVNISNVNVFFCCCRCCCCCVPSILSAFMEEQQ